jgi:putative ABC transport system ATP-binding protein
MSSRPEPELRPESAGVGISVRGLSFEYETASGALPVLDNVDFDVEPGEVIAVTGVSGSGKTTLLSLLGGLDRIQQGTVIVGGEDLGRLRRDDLARYRRETVGFVFQDFGLLGQLTALENVELALTIAGAPGRRLRRERARELLDAVGLAERMSHRPRALSGGEKQRVAIARALANRPRLILADEPTGNLDAISTAEVLSTLMQLPVEHGSTVVVVTHDELVAANARRRLPLKDGKLVSP